MIILYTERYICIMKFTPRNEQTRQFIIESTADVFNKKGYAGTSLTDLTEATNLTKGSIYGNFENKEEVAIAVFDYNIAQRSSRLESEVSKAGTYKEKMLVYATFLSVNWGSFTAKGGCPYLNTGLEADDTNETLRRHVTDALLSWKNRIVDVINKGTEAGEFKRNTDASSSAISIIALLEGGIFMSSVTRNSLYIKTASETAKNIVNSIST